MSHETRMPLRQYSLVLRTELRIETFLLEFVLRKLARYIFSNSVKTIHLCEQHEGSSLYIINGSSFGTMIRTLGAFSLFCYASTNFYKSFVMKVQFCHSTATNYSQVSFSN
jgi:hypothetical protein